MVYIRVIPRDLFNEASLLKCLGKLWIALDETRGHSARFVTEDTDGFDIRQNPEDGSIYVANVEFTVGGVECDLFRPLNSREPWPLYVRPRDDHDAEDVPVFENDGELSDAMREFIGKGL